MYYTRKAISYYNFGGASVVYTVRVLPYYVSA